MMELHAFQVAPGKEHTLVIPDGYGFHLSIVALPHNSKGRATLYVSVDGKTQALGTVDGQRNVMQFTTDLIFNYEQRVTFVAKGGATVHCTGYRQQMDADDDLPAGLGVSDEEESDDGEGAPRLPIEDAEGASEDDESDDEDDDEEEDPTQAGGETSSEGSEGSAEGEFPVRDEEMDSDDDEEGDEEDSDDDDDDEVIGGGEGDMDDSDEEDSDDDDDDDDDEEEEPVEPPTKRVRSEGRPSQGFSPAKNSPQHNSPKGGRPSFSGGSPHRSSQGGSPKGRRSN